MLVNAVAGSGKSTTCIEGARRVQASGKVAGISYLAFNKHIQVEMAARADGAVVAKTFHALGLQSISTRFGAVKVNERRMWTVIEEMREWPEEERKLIPGVKRMCQIAKNSAVENLEALAELADHHGVDLGTAQEEQQTIALVPLALEKASQYKYGEVAYIDFDDMCWLPMKLELPVRHMQLALCDESQDLNPVQQWLAIRAAERLVIVGDRNQAIYGFRGSDVKSMDNLAALVTIPGGCLGTNITRDIHEYPLSFTWRCPKSHVRLAQVIVPGIHALPGASEGVVRLREAGDVVSESLPGDMILCRTNAPLIGMAHSLIATGKRAVVKGRDIGAGILRLLSQAAGDYPGRTLAEILTAARLITDYDVQRFRLMPGGKGQIRASMAEDRLQCLLIAAQETKTLEQLRVKLTALFSDDQVAGAITLSTIHKAKGLEADRVMILKPELLPHPLATRMHEIEQEYNCLYVALTRARQELWFVDGIPPCLDDYL